MLAHVLHHLDAEIVVPPDLGLGVVERIPSFKRMAIRHAMGTLGTLPRLLRGEPL